MQSGVPMMPRYWVRVGADVRGPVDEPTIAAWIAQGMLRAEVCPEGASVYVPIQQTPFARYLPVAEAKRGVFGGAGAWKIGILALLVVGGRFGRVCTHYADTKKAKTQATLPAVGAQGELARSDGPLSLCPAGTAFWGWPCSDGKSKTVAAGSHVQIAKTQAYPSEGLCRYWIQGGPDDRFVGDAPCDWFQAQ